MVGASQPFRFTSKFRRAMKRMKKQNKDQEKLLSVVYTILEDRLTPQHRDHALKGNWAGHRECHIEGDWVLVYRFESSTLVLVDTGSHAEVFKGKY